MQIANVAARVDEAYGGRQAQEASRDVRRAGTAKENDGSAQDAQASGEGEGLLKVAEPLERFMRSVGVDISFSVDEKTDQVQAEVRSEDGKRVIRKIPSDEILRLASSIREMAKSSDRFVQRTL